MGRRASKGSTAPAPAAAAGNSKSSSNPVQQLNMLREFCAGAGSWTEAALTDCLRQCGYNVERAAERLMTGQYQASTAAAGGGSDSKKRNGKSVYVSLVSSPTTTQQKPSAQAAPKRTSSASKSSASKLSSSLAAAAPPTAAVSSKKNRRKNAPSQPVPFSALKGTPKHGSAAIQDLTGDSDADEGNGRWLLCHRWISDAICTTKNGRVTHDESLGMQHSLTGHSVVRFRGKHIEGRIPDNLASMLAPVLRMNQDGTPMIFLEGEALMEETRLPIGSQIPIALKVYIVDPRAFFELFQNQEAAANTNANMFFANKTRKSKKGRLPVAEAAFNLLQWAEYGDVPEFQAPTDGAELKEASVDEEVNDDEDDDVEEESDEAVAMNEDDFEEASVAESTAEAKEWDKQVNSTNGWMMSLPELPDPTGFRDVTLRPYQRQALYWMMKREKEGESREELDKQLALLSELATNNQKPRSSVPSDCDKEIFCDRGPVLVSDAGKKKSKTVEGQVDPVSHPLWQRRFLGSESMDESLSFYVNELLSGATHLPPAPPSSCSGGILADDMGLGKTVMLLALIIQSKEEQPPPKKEDAARPTATLVVAKLSLLPQWEDELKTKTSLSYLIYYKQPGTKIPTKEEMEAVDVVVTTYGSIQGELSRKNPVLLACNWFRVILDEAHCIKNQKTLASKVCCSLKSQHRWCVSGTIIQNSLDDVFGIMKFLRHEPWSLPAFWKAAITKPMTSASDGGITEDQEAGLKTALDRVRRLLAPLMLRRTKDSVTKDGTPILTLPPVETKIIKVDLSESEREFYNAVLARSLEVFDGFVDSGTAAKSYFQIFSLLQKLRQICDHIALTVRSRIEGDDSNASNQDDTALTEEAASSPKNSSPKKKAASDPLGQEFLNSLLEKFCAEKSSPRKKKLTDGSESPAKRPKDQTYVSKVAHALKNAVQENSTHVNEECPICLENPKIHEAVLTPCAHIFCRECLVGFLHDKVDTTTKTADENKPNIGSVLQCPDGECPCCSEKIDAKRIIVLSKSGGDGSTMTTSYLTDFKPSANRVKREMMETKEGNPHAVARTILENAVNGAESSKMTAIMKELFSIWQLDPKSKVLIFSQYLGFLDLMETQLRANGIPFFRLDGSLSLKERMVVLDQFRSSRQPNLENGVTDDLNKGTVLLMSMAAGGEGLNLVAASSVFIVDPWWNAAKEDQCVNRIHRIGQTAEVVRIRKFAVNESVEERILELQSRKKYVAEEIYNDAGRGEKIGSARLSLDEFKLIFQK
jgi:SNF2 family DNA or RNA helicase